MWVIQLRGVDDTDVLAEFRVVKDGVGVQLGSLWFARQFTQFGGKELLLGNIEILIAE
jgi:hypothetical protein